MARMLDRLQAAIAPGLPRGLYTWSQRVCEQIEETFDTVAGAELDLVDLTAASEDYAIITSYAIPGTILTGADVGATATIAVANHSRRYGDGTTVSVTGATLSAFFSFSTTYYVYYDQASRAGGAVTYNATTNPNTAAPSKATGRHFCGVITTPANGAGNTTGGVAPPWGGGAITAADIGSTP